MQKCLLSLALLKDSVNKAEYVLLPLVLRKGAWGALNQVWGEEPQEGFVSFLLLCLRN